MRYFFFCFGFFFSFRIPVPFATFSPPSVLSVRHEINVTLVPPRPIKKGQMLGGDRGSTEAWPGHAAGRTEEANDADGPFSSASSAYFASWKMMPSV